MVSLELTPPVIKALSLEEKTGILKLAKILYNIFRSQKMFSCTFYYEFEYVEFSYEKKNKQRFILLQTVDENAMY